MQHRERQAASIGAWIAMAAATIVLVERGAALGVGAFALGAQALAVASMIWARVTFGVRSFHAGSRPTDGALVTRGPFAFVRNPIYASILLFVGAAVASHASWTNGALGLVVLAGAVARALLEEAELRARYPEYAAYAARTPRFVPFVI